MRIIFMGSPDFAVPTLEALVAAGHEVVAAYTQPPRPAGRGKADRQTAVEVRARELGIEVRSPRSLKRPEEQAAFAALDAELAVVAAYGLILPQAVLDAPDHGCLNVHGSLLPRWRGAAPVQRAIMAGDAVTGVTIMAMQAGLDTGPMLLAEKTRCAGKHAGYLERELSIIGAKMMVRVLGDLSAFPPVRQSETGVTYAHKIQKDEGRIDFNSDAEFIDRQILAFNPPGAFFEFRGERIRILKADCDAGTGEPGLVINENMRIACGTDAISPVTVQRAGRKEMGVFEFLRGFPIPAGTRLA